MEFNLKEYKRIIGLIADLSSSVENDIENLKSQISEFEKIKAGLVETYGESPSETDFWAVQSLYDYIKTSIANFERGISDYGRQSSCEHDNIIFNAPFQNEVNQTMYRTYCKDCQVTIEQKNQNGMTV